jgi:hypothetical protein
LNLVAYPLVSISLYIFGDKQLRFNTSVEQFYIRNACVDVLSNLTTIVALLFMAML